MKMLGIGAVVAALGGLALLFAGYVSGLAILAGSVLLLVAYGVSS